MTQPADIVERLELFEVSDALGDGDFSVCIEAAAEITRLRGQVKRVQSAAKTIMIGEADELRRLREQHREWHLAVNSLDSEREANAVLTCEVEVLRAELAEAHQRGVKAGLDEAAKWLDNWGDATMGQEIGSYYAATAIRAIDPTTLTAGDGDHG